MQHYKAEIITIIICGIFFIGFVWMLVTHFFKSDSDTVEREPHWHRDKNGVFTHCVDKQCIKPKQI